MKTNLKNATRLLSALCITLAAVASVPVHAQSLPTIVVQPHPVDLTLPAEAVVEALNQATLASQVSGRVTEVRVDAGQVVKKATC